MLDPAQVGSMGPHTMKIIYEIDSKKVVKESLRLIEGNEEYSGIINLMTAPLVMIENRGIWYLSTKNTTPQEIVELGYVYKSPRDNVNIPMHPVFIREDGKLAFDHKPVFKFTEARHTFLEDYTRPILLAGWFEKKEVATAWTRFLNGLDRIELP